MSLSLLHISRPPMRSYRAKYFCMCVLLLPIIMISFSVSSFPSSSSFVFVRLAHSLLYIKSFVYSFSVMLIHS